MNQNMNQIGAFKNDPALKAAMMKEIESCPYCGFDVRSELASLRARNQGMLFGAMDECVKAGYMFDIGHNDVRIYFGTGDPPRIPYGDGPPSEALLRAIMQATVWMKEEEK